MKRVEDVRVTVVDWAGEAEGKMRSIGIPPGVTTDDPLELVREFFDAGLNVMIARNPGDGSIQVLVDTKRFTQR